MQRIDVQSVCHVCGTLEMLSRPPVHSCDLSMKLRTSPCCQIVPLLVPLFGKTAAAAFLELNPYKGAPKHCLDQTVARLSQAPRIVDAEHCERIKGIWQARERSRKSSRCSGEQRDELLEKVRRRMSSNSNLASNKSFIEGRISPSRPTDYRLAIIKWVNGHYFDYVMGTLLVLNAVAVGAQVDYMAGHGDTTVPIGFRVLDVMFCLVFGAELALRVAVVGRAFFSRSEVGWKWNWFDALMVMFAFLDELSILLMSGTKVQDLTNGLGVLRILRLGRIARLVRMVRLIPELKSMVYLITASMWSFWWTVVLLLMLVYCFAVYFTELSTEITHRTATEDTVDAEVMLTYWGSLPKSVLALLMAITGGDDWRNFVIVFAEDPLYLVYVMLFATYIAFATMVMLNLVTGVFVDGAQKMLTQEQEDQLIRIAAKIFVDADKDHSETISFEEFLNMVDSRRLDDWFSALGFSLTEADKLFVIIDEDDSGCLSLSEFVRGCLKLKGNVKACDMALLKYNLKMQGVEMARFFSRLEAHIIRAVGCTSSNSDDAGGVCTSQLPLPASEVVEEVLV
mmetsp:Transcript_43025/g.85211  ORF Transcript_43025/g.85211 Transcript_43025/m.85211 type:complete len:567 (+) Transcript_43025:390-2090(+)